MYRPIGLAPVGTSTVAAGHANSYADRRRAAADRLQLAEELSTRLEAAVGADAVHGGDVDPGGVLRACVRALVPVAQRTPSFEVTVSLGPDHVWAARLAHGGDGPAVELVRGPGPSAATSVHGPQTASETRVATELATLLWTGTVSGR